MTITIAMPVAHVTGTPAYASYYVNGVCVFRVPEDFNERVTATQLCQGLRLTRAPEAASAAAALFDVFAMTHGYLSLRGESLILRLPRELRQSAAHNSGGEYLKLMPAGPQLRHVVYRFEPAAPRTQIQTFVQAILNRTPHAAETLLRVTDPANPSGPPLDWATYRTRHGVTAVIQGFMAGTLEIFVEAGDVIANFSSAGTTLELRFHDSCGSVSPPSGAASSSPPDVRGRPLNPVFFLYLLRHSQNSARVTHRTVFRTAAPPDPLNETHPIEHLWSTASINARGTDFDNALDVRAALPPPPLQYTIQVRNAGGTAIAERGVSIDSLGAFHQSYNASNPARTMATVEWRNVGTDPADTVLADRGKLLTRVRTGFANRTPTGFNPQFPPSAAQSTLVQAYWARYGEILNAVARAMQIPCEHLITITCTETGSFFNTALGSSQEMNVVRFEPFASTTVVNNLTTDLARRTQLNAYATLTGTTGANRNIPIPWSGGTAVTTNLSWDQLAEICDLFGGTGKVNVSPGAFQTTLIAALVDLPWLFAIYGTGVLARLAVTINGVRLTPDPVPNNRRDLLRSWFGVSVDANGQNTTTQANVHADLTRMKRALHNAIAGGAHIRRRYNTAEQGRTHFNFITDYDPPTVMAGYNSGGLYTRLITTSSQDELWKRLFGMVFFNRHYPESAPALFNAIVAHFNAATIPNPMPALRLWRE